MIDKSKELNASISLINDRLHFKGIVGDNIPISIDYIPPLGDNLGYTSLELLLLSLTSCIGSAVLTFLRKMKKTINGFEINSKGIRKEEHPTGFKTIFIEINLKSPDVKEDDLNKVIKLTEETYCPVWSMLKGNVEININYNIIS
jgi:putative redox protein